MVILKSVLVSMLFGSITSYVIGGTASLISFITMYIAYKLIKDKGSMVSVSVIGGFFHIITQLVVVAIIYRLGEVVLYYGALMIIISLITSLSIKGAISSI